MADVHPTPPHAGKIGEFLQQSTAGLPNWGWILVIGGGIAAAILIPKFLPGTASSTTNSTSGLGLAVDPTSGLPYAVEGLVPSGANAGTTTTGGTTTNTTGRVNTTTINPPPPTVFTRNDPTGANNAIPIWKTPNVDWSQDIGSIPINTSVQIGRPVQTGTQTFFPVTYNNTTGYVGSWDLAGLPAQNNVTWPYANNGVYGGTRSG